MDSPTARASSTECHRPARSDVSFDGATAFGIGHVAWSGVNPRGSRTGELTASVDKTSDSSTNLNRDISHPSRWHRSSAAKRRGWSSRMIASGDVVHQIHDAFLRHAHTMNSRTQLFQLRHGQVVLGDESPQLCPLGDTILVSACCPQSGASQLTAIALHAPGKLEGRTANPDAVHSVDHSLGTRRKGLPPWGQAGVEQAPSRIWFCRWAIRSATSCIRDREESSPWFCIGRPAPKRPAGSILCCISEIAFRRRASICLTHLQ